MSTPITAIAAIVGALKKVKRQKDGNNMAKVKMNMGVAIALGTLIGISIGSALHQLAMGLVLGISLGVALGAFSNRKPATRAE